jgi:integrase
MIRRRDRADGLPFRVYERRGKLRYSIGYKRPDGTWAYRLQCKADDRTEIARLRSEAIKRAGEINLGKPAADTFEALSTAWLAWQRKLPEDSEERRAESTLDENAREIATLNKAFGHMRVGEMVKADAYTYLDACLTATDKAGNPRPRPAKGNKEVTLAHLILEYGVRCGKLMSNPFDGVAKLKTRVYQRLVTQDEMDLAVRVGRGMKSAQHIVALALKTAWLCAKRSVEVRALTRDQFKEDGIEWTGAKRQRGAPVRKGIIEWSDELRATVEEALTVKRGKLAGVWYVFGNTRGGRYTKGGWGKTLRILMDECVRVAAEEKIAFLPFSLQDCRPKGVTDKIDAGHDDVQDATLHTNRRMIDQTYDRRRVRVAKPVR